MAAELAEGLWQAGLGGMDDVSTHFKCNESRLIHRECLPPFRQRKEPWINIHVPRPLTVMVRSTRLSRDVGEKLAHAL